MDEEMEMEKRMTGWKDEDCGGGGGEGGGEGQGLLHGAGADRRQAAAWPWWEGGVDLDDKGKSVRKASRRQGRSATPSNALGSRFLRLLRLLLLLGQRLGECLQTIGG